MCPIPGEPLDTNRNELTTSDGRKFKIKAPGLAQPQPKPKRTEERSAAEPPRDDPRPPINPHHVGL